MLQGIAPVDKIYVLSTRIGIMILLVLMIFLIRIAWRHRLKESEIL